MIFITYREKALAVNRPERTAGHTLRELAASSGISEVSYEYQRLAIAREDKCARVRARVREAFEAVNASRGHRHVTHALRSGEDPIAVPEKAVGGIMREAAYSTLAPCEHPVIHDDRGCHYHWPGWISICERHGLIRPVSAKGCSPRT